MSYEDAMPYKVGECLNIMHSITHVYKEMRPPPHLQLAQCQRSSNAMDDKEKGKAIQKKKPLASPVSPPSLVFEVPRSRYSTQQAPKQVAALVKALEILALPEGSRIAVALAVGCEQAQLSFFSGNGRSSVDVALSTRSSATRKLSCSAVPRVVSAQYAGIKYIACWAVSITRE